MLAFGTWILAPWTLLLSQRRLLVATTQRDLAARYRGSMFGVLWSLITPLMMLLVFSFVFTQIFESRWPSEQGKGHFATILFCGLLLFQFFSESLTRSPAIIGDNVSLVKKVVFPVEILPVMVVLSAIVNSGTGFVVLLVGYLGLQGIPPATLLLLPMVVIPFIAMAMGIAWILAALGVYVRDVTQAMGILSTVLMFLSGVFYPPEVLPERWRVFLYLSPATLPIEQARNLLFEGRVPNLSAWLVYSAAAFLIAACGLSFFKKLGSGFADVV